MSDETMVSRIREIIGEVTDRWPDYTPEGEKELVQRMCAAFPDRNGEEIQEAFREANRQDRSEAAILRLTIIVCDKARAKYANIGENSTVKDCVRVLGEDDPDVISLTNALFDALIEKTGQEGAI